MIVGLSVVILLAVVALVWHGNRQTGVVLHTISDLERPESTPTEYDDGELRALIDANSAMLLTLAADIKDLHLAVAEGIENASRAERRVRAVVQSAKRRFEAEGYVDPGVEAEAESLSEHDEATGTVEGLQLVHDGLDEAGEYDPWNAVPGVGR